jgi:predicted ester cyclase
VLPGQRWGVMFRRSIASRRTKMSAERARQILQQYAEALLARGDYARFFAEDVEFSVIGTDQRAHGRNDVERAIRFLHETAFDARPEFKTVVVEEHAAAIEADFVGTHTADFAGEAATGRSVRVPYSVFYDLGADKIKGLRIYMPMDALLGQIRGASQAEVANSSA